MAYVSREMEATAVEVFDVLVDPETYPDWLAGTANIRGVDHNWPSPGATFHHTVGARPFAIADVSTVLDVEPNRSLTLEVKARPLVSAVVRFRLVGDGDRCVLCWEEEPTPRILGNVVRPLMDPITHIRNHVSLRRLADVVRRRQEAGVPERPRA